MANYVIVHGGFAGGWYMRPVATLLEAAGQDVCTPTLTGFGEQSHLVNLRRIVIVDQRDKRVTASC